MPSLSKWYKFCFVCRCVHEDFAISYFWYCLHSGCTFQYVAARHKIQQTSWPYQRGQTHQRVGGWVWRWKQLLSHLGYWILCLLLSPVSLCDLKLWLYTEENMGECGTRVGDEETVQSLSWQTDRQHKVYICTCFAYKKYSNSERTFSKNSSQAFSYLHVWLCGALGTKINFICLMKIFHMSYEDFFMKKPSL